jgi:hypothetical protein
MAHSTTHHPKASSLRRLAKVAQRREPISPFPSSSSSLVLPVKSRSSLASLTLLVSVHVTLVVETLHVDFSSSSFNRSEHLSLPTTCSSSPPSSLSVLSSLSSLSWLATGLLRRFRERMVRFRFYPPLSYTTLTTSVSPGVKAAGFGVIADTPRDGSKRNVRLFPLLFLFLLSTKPTIFSLVSLARNSPSSKTPQR